MNKQNTNRSLSSMAVDAMNAGLNGEKLPNFGQLPAFQVELLNTIYDAARNRRAGDRIIALRVR